LEKKLSMRAFFMQPDPAARASARVRRPKALETTIRESIHRFQVTDYLREYFREHRGGLFRKRISVETLSQFQPTPINEPLLKNLADKFATPACKCFSAILHFTGADTTQDSGKIKHIERIIDILGQNAEIRDEVYFQLIKQTRGNPNPDCLYATWQIFFIVASVFPCSRSSEEIIRHYIQQSASTDDTRVAEIAHFTAIRFITRCQIGRPLPLPLEVADLMRMTTDPVRETALFGASLEEQMWCQRVRFPDLPVPVMPHQIATIMLSRGAEQREGIFRLPGNMKKVKELEAAIARGPSALKSAELNDLGSLLKSWYGSLPEQLIPKEIGAKIPPAAPPAQFVEIADQLPPLNRLTLKYLIGFLQRVTKAQEVTKMGPKNLAICFCPNLIDMSSAVDPMKAAKLSDTAQAFVIALIENWDTSEVYPLADDLAK
jgi:hypothetical protein